MESQLERVRERVIAEECRHLLEQQGWTVTEKLDERSWVTTGTLGEAGFLIARPSRDENWRYALQAACCRGA